MYGLILTNLAEYIIATYGEDKWETIRKSAGCAQVTFGTHQVYPDSLIPKLGIKACKILGISEREFYQTMGKFFVTFIGQYGYDRVLSVLGRHFRDFINNLDNLHEYLRFSYPRMKPPSFFCEKEDEKGLTLHYRSKRRGFVWYVMGQIQEVGQHFYDTEIKVELINEEYLFDTVHVVFRLEFDNTAYKQGEADREVDENLTEIYKPVNGHMFFEIFPFTMIFGPDLVIKTMGNSLLAVLPHIMQRKLTDAFDLIKPLIDGTWNSILQHTNNIFELVTVEPVMSHEKSDINDTDSVTDSDDLCLHLKGQMIYIDEWESLVFLGTPVMSDLDALMRTGLYINDLSMHDFSRDLVLAGQQQSAEIKMALAQEQTKSKQLQDSMKKLDMERSRTDELLYQMIPKQIADKLRGGDSSVSTCQYFDSVTILFSDVVGFTSICSRISPMEVVSMLNAMYSIFDQLTERHKVYKVETIGDAYMVVSGAPEANEKHAEDICFMALDMVVLIQDLKDPSTDESLNIRVGIHSGAVVAGVVGLKMPRYCLFGDTVNTASKMESSSEKLKIHITEYTKYLLKPEEWKIKERGSITVKEKGKMKTFWLQGSKMDRPNPREGIQLEIKVPQRNISSMGGSSRANGTASRSSMYTPAGITLSPTAGLRKLVNLSPANNNNNNNNTNVDDEKKRSIDNDLAVGNLNKSVTTTTLIKNDLKPDIKVSKPTSATTATRRSLSNSSLYKVASKSILSSGTMSPQNKVAPKVNPDVEIFGEKEPNLNRVAPTIIKSTVNQSDIDGKPESIKRVSVVGDSHKASSITTADKLLHDKAEEMLRDVNSPDCVSKESSCLGRNTSLTCHII
ncbi:Uncharacterised protein g8817 [Pycnogonum litorale]